MRHWRTNGNNNMATKNRKYLDLYLRKYDRYHQNSNGKPVVFDHGELQDSNNDRQPEMAAESRNTYISETMRDTIKISTENPGLSTVVSSTNVSSSDCGNDRQPEKAMWPPKSEIFISLKPWQQRSKFQRQIWGFRLCRARRNCSQAITITTNNRKWQYRRFAIYPALSQSLCCIFIEHVVVEKSEFAVGNSTLSVTVSEM